MRPGFKFRIEDAIPDGRPFYLVLAGAITRKIIEGDLHPGDMLPSTNAFAVIFEKAPGTISQALAHLERQGIIQRIQGSGTYVTESSLTNAAANRTGNTPLTMVTEQTILQCQINGVEISDLIESLKTSLSIHKRQDTAQ